MSRVSVHLTLRWLRSWLYIPVSPIGCSAGDDMAAGKLITGETSADLDVFFVLVSGYLVRLLSSLCVQIGLNL